MSAHTQTRGGVCGRPRNRRQDPLTSVASAATSSSRDRSRSPHVASRQSSGPPRPSSGSAPTAMPAATATTAPVDCSASCSGSRAHGTSPAHRHSSPGHRRASHSGSRSGGSRSSTSSRRSRGSRHSGGFHHSGPSRTPSRSTSLHGSHSRSCSVLPHTPTMDHTLRCILFLDH